MASRTLLGRVIPLCLVVLFLLASGASVSHSHPDGQASSSACAVCQMAETSADEPGRLFVDVAYPSAPILQPPVDDHPRGRIDVDRSRARSPPA